MDLERALTRLPEEFKTPLLLAEVEGLPLEDVARIMDCPIGTVKSRIFRAKERLRGHLKDYSEDPRGLSMAHEPDDSYGDDAELGRLLRERLPRHPVPGRLRASIVAAAADGGRGARWIWQWGPPAAAALAMAMLMLLWSRPRCPPSWAATPCGSCRAR